MNYIIVLLFLISLLTISYSISVFYARFRLVRHAEVWVNVVENWNYMNIITPYGLFIGAIRKIFSEFVAHSMLLLCV